MAANKPYRIILSGGGTGGHIYPAIAVANMLKELLPSVEILFVGALGKMEMEKVPKAGYNIVGLPIAGIHRKQPWRNLLFPIKLISSLMRASAVLKEFKPDAVVGFGGYASGPVLKIAERRGLPVVIQEQNSFAGKTNKWLAEKAFKICVAYDGMEKFFPKEKIKFTGNPVRKDIYENEINREEALAHFNLSFSKKTVLIIGGSLGARTINESIKANVNQLLEKGYQVLWQTGKFYYNDLKSLDSQDIKVHDFIYDMDKAYAAADIVISRAGALSVSELCLVKKPTVLVPSPNVAEDHQTKNAMALVEKSAAVLVKDDEAKETLVKQVIDLLEDDGKLEELQNNIAEMGRPKAASDIANTIIEALKS